MAYFELEGTYVSWTGSRLSWSTYSSSSGWTYKIALPDNVEALTYSILSERSGDFPNVELENVIAESNLINGPAPADERSQSSVYFGQIDWGDGLSTVVLVFRSTDGFGHVEGMLALAGAPLPRRLTTLNWDDFYNSITYKGPVKDFPGASAGQFPISEISLAEVSPLPAIHSTGTEEDDAIDGGIGQDEISGGAGNDNLTGHESNDRLLGEAGNDTLDGGLGADTLNGGDGDDIIIGGSGEGDLRDVIFAGEGNDSVDAGAGNDQIFGQGGNDTIAGGAGVDEIQGQDGDDVITGSSFSDLVFGGAGDDFVNGGFGHDRINGGTGADKFFHVGVEGHGSDWVQDYSSAEGDVLLFGNTSATRTQFQVNFNHTANAAGERAGDDAVQEAFVIYRPTGQIMWALVDGAGQSAINLQIGADMFDLLA